MVFIDDRKAFDTVDRFYINTMQQMYFIIITYFEIIIYVMELPMSDRQPFHIPTVVIKSKFKRIIPHNIFLKYN